MLLNKATRASAFGEQLPRHMHLPESARTSAQKVVFAVGKTRDERQHQHPQVWETAELRGKATEIHLCFAFGEAQLRQPGQSCQRTERKLIHNHVPRDERPQFFESLEETRRLCAS